MMTDSTENNIVVHGNIEDGDRNQVKHLRFFNNSFDNLNEEETRHVKRGIYKNVVIISVAFMFLFTAYESMASLQSSINKVCTYLSRHLPISLFIVRLHGN